LVSEDTTLISAVSGERRQEHISLGFSIFSSGCSVRRKYLAVLNQSNNSGFKKTPYKIKHFTTEGSSPFRS